MSIPDNTATERDVYASVTDQIESAGAVAGASEAGYQGGNSILKDWLQLQRAAGMATAVRRLETPPGKQAPDWGHLGCLETGGEQRRVSGFTITLGYSRRMWAQAALDQKLGTLLRMLEAAFGSGVQFPKRSCTTA